MKDKKFKSKNNDKNYIKDKAPDLQLGRHREQSGASQKAAASRKNRVYQQRQAEAMQDMRELETDYKTEMSNTEINIESVSQEIKPAAADNAISFSPVKPQKQSEFEKTTQTAKKNRKYQNKSFVSRTHTQMKTQFEVAPEVQAETRADETDGYNFKDAIEQVKEKSALPEKQDMQFGRHTEKSSTVKSGKPTSKQKNRLTQKYNPLIHEEQTEHSRTPIRENEDTQKNVLSGEPAEPNGEQTDVSEQVHDDFQFERTLHYEKKAEQSKNRAAKAEKKLPHKKKMKRQRVYDEEKKKPKNRLQFEKEVKPQQEAGKQAPVKSAAKMIGYQAGQKIHSKISEAQQENTAVEAAHKTEQKAETLAQYSIRTTRTISQNRKNAPYKKAAKLQYKAEKAEVKAIYEKTIAQYPKLKKSPVKRFMQKQRIKKQYQTMKRGQQTAKTAKTAAIKTEKAAVKFAAFIGRHKGFFGIVLLIALLIIWLGSALSSCSIMGTTGINSILVSSYFAEDADIYAAEDYYKELESGLQSDISRIERTHPGYDEYRYNVAGIGHNPYELISYLTAAYEDFTFDDVKSELDRLLNQQYTITLTEETETRYKAEERTDENGNTYTAYVEYTYRILNVTLINNGIRMLVNANLSNDQAKLYGIYLVSKGNRDYLFADDIYSNESQEPGYTIPGEALTDETFRRLITEAEKYLGYPYVWGGSSPSTSFDCSGFVCWVFKNSGVYPLHRTTAQGVYNQCAVISRADAKPGDIVFFTGTYSTSDAVTHLGIYVGDGMMIHCGNPISYASIDSSYWSAHYYAFGRLN